jgi:hypothetical protein
MPPHNLREIAEAAIQMLKHPDTSTQELMAHIPGPDFPGGGQIISAPADILSAYETGRGRIYVRARTHIEVDESRGKEAIIVSRTAEGAAKGVATAQGLIATLAQNGLADPAQAKAAQGRFSTSHNPEEAVRSVQLFVESIAENLAIKQEYFARLDAAAPDTILCSNTSGISITEIAAKCRKPERVLTTHFWNPPYIMPLVEVIMGKRSSQQIAEGVVALLKACGKVPVLVTRQPAPRLAELAAIVKRCGKRAATG